MKFAIFVSIIQICFFVSMVNYFFQRNKLKYIPKEEKMKLKRLELPTTWLIFAAVFVLILIGAFGISIRNISNGFSNIKKQQSVIEQYNEDSSGESTGDSQSTDSQSSDSQTNGSQSNDSQTTNN